MRLHHKERRAEREPRKQWRHDTRELLRQRRERDADAQIEATRRKAWPPAGSAAWRMGESAR